MMYRLVIFIMFYLPFVVFGQSLSQTFDKIFSLSCFKYASVAAIVVDLNSGDTLYERNSHLLLQPASTLKLMTTAAALQTLGENYRFKTLLQYTGIIKDSVLYGDLYIKGFGDPTLGSRYFEATDNHNFLSNWVNAIKRAGIKRIKGKIIADASIYGWQVIPGKWAWEDIGNYYGAAPTALTILDNAYVIHFRTGKYSGAPTYITKITPYIPNLSIKNYVRTANIHSDQAYIYGAPYTYQRIVKGRLPKYKRDFKVKGSMPDPPLYAAYMLFDTLKKTGILADTFTTIRILGDTNLIYNARKTLYTGLSLPLREIVIKTNRKSINLFAELLLRAIALRLNDKPDADNAPQALIDFWLDKGIPDTIQIYDGSGLSAYDAVSAADLLFVLTYMYKSNHFNTFKQSLPVAGVYGTLKSYCRKCSAKGKVFAKTGTLRRTKAFAGYVFDDNRSLAFVIIVNHYRCRSRIAKIYFERLLCALGSL